MILDCNKDNNNLIIEDDSDFEARMRAEKFICAHNQIATLNNGFDNKNLPASIDNIYSNNPNDYFNNDYIYFIIIHANDVTTLKDLDSVESITALSRSTRANLMLIGDHESIHNMYLLNYSRMLQIINASTKI